VERFFSVGVRGGGSCWLLAAFAIGGRIFSSLGFAIGNTFFERSAFPELAGACSFFRRT